MPRIFSGCSIFGTLIELTPLISRIPWNQSFSWKNMLVPHKLNQHSIIDMLRVNPVNGNVSRVRSLARLFRAFGNELDRKDAQTQISNDAPAQPAPPPQQALPNPQLGTRAFLARQKSFSVGRRNRNTRNAGKAATNLHPDSPGLAAEDQEDQNERKVVARIPRNVLGERQIKAAKSRKRLVADMAEQQRSAIYRSGSSKGKRKRVK